MAYAHLFYGDYRYSDNPLAFLTRLETTLVNLPHLSESEKCYRLFLNCKVDSDAEAWYENLESNSPAVVASWPTLVLHFRVKWLGASPNLLLEIPKTIPVPTRQPGAATTISHETSTTTIANTNTTTAIPAHTNTPVPSIFGTTATLERLDQEVDM